MTDVPILTPSECVALAAIEVKMASAPWFIDRNSMYYSREAPNRVPNTTDDCIGIVALRNAVPCMLATIAELREEVRETKFRPLGDNHHNAALCPYCEAPLTKARATIAAHEATIAKLKRQLEERQ